MNPTPTQQFWLNCTATEALYTGMHGAGKTFALVLGAFAAKEGKGSALFAVSDIQQCQYLFDYTAHMAHESGRRPKAHRSRLEIELASGGLVRFVHGTDPTRMNTLRGTSKYDFVGFDQIANFPDDSVYRVACAALAKSPGARIRSTLATAPNGWIQDHGPGKQWVMERFMGAGMAFPITSNPHLPPDFRDRLRPFAWRGAE